MINKNIKFLIVYLATTLAFSIACYQVYDMYKEEQAKLLVSKANEKALMVENGTLDGKVRVLNQTIDEVNASNDSISNAFKELKKSKKVKDKNVVSLQHFEDTFLKKDTITLKDTLLINNSKLDTIIGNKHYSLELHFQYPNTLTTGIKINNKKNVLVSTVRETVEPPKKFFLARWFQKKQTVAVVDIEDSNPYIESGKTRHIQVIK